MTVEDTATTLLRVGGALLFFTSIISLILGIMAITALPSLFMFMPDPFYFYLFGTVLIWNFIYAMIFLIFGIIGFILAILCFAWSNNPAPRWSSLIAVGIISTIVGFGIGIILIVAAILAHQASQRQGPRRSRVIRRDPRVARRPRRVYRYERLDRFRHFDQKIAESMQAAQKSLKAKRWRTVVKHAWSATEALLDKLYQINFDEPISESLSVEAAIRKLTPHLPLGRQTAAAITEIYQTRRKIKPGSRPVKQEDAEKTLAAAQQLCFWFNIRLDTETEAVPPTTPKEEVPPEGLCGVCNLQLQAGQRMLKTPCCDVRCHYACLSEWVKIKRVCPRCRKGLQFSGGEIRLRG